MAKGKFPAAGTVYFSELFAFLKEADSDTEKEEYLVDFVKLSPVRNQIPLYVIMEILYKKPAFKFGLPPGAPPYRDAHEITGQGPSNFFHTHKKIKYFIESMPDFIKNPIKREKVLLGLLESMDKNESDFFVKLKDRDPEVLRAFPEKVLRKLYPNVLK